MIENELRELWERVRSRGNYPTNWIKRWRLSLNFDLEFLRLSDMRLAIPKGKVSNCGACQEICCTGPKAIIHLRFKDIARLLDQGLALHIATPQIYAKGYATKTQAEKEFDESLFAQVFPTLTRDRQGTCQLLTDDLKCSVYPRWPLSCARYPFAVDAANKVIYYAKGCSSFELVEPDAASNHFGYLVNAAVESYNERIKDVLLLAYAYEELEALGLTQYLDSSVLKKDWRWLVR